MKADIVKEWQRHSPCSDEVMTALQFPQDGCHSFKLKHLASVECFFIAKKVLVKSGFCVIKELKGVMR